MKHVCLLVKDLKRLTCNEHTHNELLDSFCLSKEYVLFLIVKDKFNFQEKYAIKKIYRNIYDVLPLNEGFSLCLSLNSNLIVEE
jgi:hypothetical protein